MNAKFQSRKITAFRRKGLRWRQCIYPICWYLPASIARNGNLEVPAYFLIAKQGYCQINGEKI
jgi:hypothetical protein